jgi:hypothetical protein
MGAPESARLSGPQNTDLSSTTLFGECPILNIFRSGIGVSCVRLSEITRPVESRAAIKCGLITVNITSLYRDMTATWFDSLIR